MAPVTEVAIISLKPGTSLDPASDTGKLLQSALDTIKTQPGFQRTFYSLEAEDPSTLRLFIDWDTIEAHHAFMSAPDYAPFMKTFEPLLAGPPTLWHAELAPHPPTQPLSAPATEVLTAYFEKNLSDTDRAKFEKDLGGLLDAVKSFSGFRGFSGGWGVEKIKVPKTGEEGTPFLGVVGWESIEAHMAFRETQGFKDAIGPLRTAKGLVDMAAVHVHAQQS